VSAEILNGLEDWQLRAFSIDVSRAIVESGLIENMDESKAFQLTEKLRIQELSKE
jgi:hypothetical protein